MAACAVGLPRWPVHLISSHLSTLHQGTGSSLHTASPFHSLSSADDTFHVQALDYSVACLEYRRIVWHWHRRQEAIQQPRYCCIMPCPSCNIVCSRDEFRRCFVLQVHGTLLNDATLLGTRIGTVLEYFGTKLRDSAFLYLLGFLRQLEHLLYCTYTAYHPYM